MNVHHSPPEQGRENRDVETGTWKQGRGNRDAKIETQKQRRENRDAKKRDQSSGEKLIIRLMHLGLQVIVISII